VSEDKAFGTADPHAPVSRADFERAIRSLNMSDVDLRDSLIQLAARVITLTDELTRRLDGVEPHPAPPNTPAEPPSGTVEAVVAGTIGETLRQIRAADAGSSQRVSLEASGEDKYAIEPSTPPCAELMPICQARCCTLSFALSTADLDEGVVRWDYGQPYLIRQRASDGYCVHNAPDTHFCSVHEQRPRICRRYDCRNDSRIWSDFENRVLAPPSPEATRDPEPKPTSSFDLVERARRRAIAMHVEMTAISETFADPAPTLGPVPNKP
jgi:Fe-S-cluster containining protein